MSTWLILALAISSEVIGTTALRESEAFSKLVPVVVMLSAYALSLYLLSIVVRDLPLGLTYAIWSGAGTALIAAIGVARFGESVTGMAMIGIAFVIAGIVLINVAGVDSSA